MCTLSGQNPCIETTETTKLAELDHVIPPTGKPAVYWILLSAKINDRRKLIVMIIVLIYVQLAEQ